MTSLEIKAVKAFMRQFKNSPLPKRTKEVQFKEDLYVVLILDLYTELARPDKGKKGICLEEQIALYRVVGYEVEYVEEIPSDFEY